MTKSKKIPSHLTLPNVGDLLYFHRENLSNLPQNLPCSRVDERDDWTSRSRSKEVAVWMIIITKNPRRESKRSIHSRRSIHCSNAEAHLGKQFRTDSERKWLKFLLKTSPLLWKIVIDSSTWRHSVYWMKVQDIISCLMSQSIWMKVKKL